MKLSRRQWGAIVLALAATVIAEWWMGRLWFGPDGRFGWFESDIWSSSQSQRVLDPYSITHIVHGFGFYALLWLAARRSPASTRLIAAVCLESLWEIMENSPIIIDRYRAVTIAQGYVGDSILNSASDVVMMVIGFLMAWRFRVAASVAAVVAAEVLMAAFFRDNLTLNILMLVWPLEGVKAWQMVGH